jgi:hypothetical protein
MMSMSKRRPEEGEERVAEGESVGGQFNTGGRERRETEKSGGAPGGRMGVKQVGRMLSISKRPPPAQQSDAAGADSQDRARPAASSGGAEPEKKAPRMGLKAAGRIMSFSRRPSTAGEDATKGRSGPAQSKGTGSDGGVRAAAPPIQISPPSSSPRLDGRANKFFFSEINSAAIKSGAALRGESHIRVPVLVMAEYCGPVSKNKWFIDAFALPHNAVRRECIDLYDILMALARCRPDADVSRDDMRDFCAWWAVAEQFFRCYFKMEREVLFPWVDTAGSKDWELQMALSKMRTMKDGLEDHLAEVNKAWEGIDSLPPGELFGAVYRAVDLFCPRVMNYFSDQEILLPQIVKGFYRIEDRLEMDKDMLAAYMGEPLTRKNKDLPHHNLVLLVRWIANPRQLRAWIAKNLNSTGRSAYSKWHASYEAEHSRLVKSFRNRSRVCAIAALAQ